MASSIDPTVPAEESALSSDPVRVNFIAAKSEIEALQAAVPVPIDYAVMRLAGDPVETEQGATWLRFGSVADPEDYPLASAPLQVVPVAVAVDNPGDCYLSGGGNNLVLLGDGNSDVAYSLDGGLTWAASALPEGVYGSDRPIAYGNGVFVLIRSDAAYSDDGGATWDTATMPEDVNWQQATYGNGVFVTVQSDGDGAAYSDDDGATWTAATLPAEGYWRQATYGDGVFVTGYDDVVVYSEDDGVNWTAGVLPNYADFETLYYANGLFVVLNDNYLFYSDDGGATWAYVALPAGNFWSKITYLNGVWIIFPQSSDSAHIYCYSSDNLATFETVNGYYYRVRNNIVPVSANTLVVSNDSSNIARLIVGEFVGTPALLNVGQYSAYVRVA